jgi:hypothetical protein
MIEEPAGVSPTAASTVADVMTATKAAETAIRNKRDIVRHSAVADFKSFVDRQRQ